MRRQAIVVFLTGIICLAGFRMPAKSAEDAVMSYIVDPQKQDLQFYWKDGSGQRLGSIQRLKDWCESRQQRLVFAMNGGMYDSVHSPVGLYIEQGRMIKSVDSGAGTGNFYLRPNGVFYITKERRAVICTTAAFRDSGRVAYATQSGPMLLIDGAFHPALMKGSHNLNIRNGVGILPGGRVLFAITKEPMNFYDFAAWFQAQGCRDALYLDGFVSRAWMPEKGWQQADGDFGVMMAVTEKKSGGD